MLGNIFILLVTAVGITANAEDKNYVLTKSGGSSFVVPTYFGDPAVGDRIQGQMYYDALSGTFKGINGAGNVDILTAGGAVSSGGIERIERINFSDAAGPLVNCGTSPCHVNSQSTPGLFTVTRTATGIYRLVIPAGTFSAAPTCVCNALDSTARRLVCDTNGPNTATAVDIITEMGGATVTQLDSIVSMVCMGPKP